jgi:two-component sensor histidine kinase
MSLKDRDALLKEVHHRVKNNLQVISSLLSMEARRSNSATTKEVLSEMKGRIYAMAQLHESLYRSGTYAAVDLGFYLGEIATKAFQAQQTSNQQVRLRLHMGSIPAGMDQAIACGLLVNELVSNCMKHGFPAEHSGEVLVELQAIEANGVLKDTLWRLSVSDTGVGLPSDFNERRKSSLGLQLVEDLSQQLGGVLEIAPRSGAGPVFVVVFKVLEIDPLVMPL